MKKHIFILILTMLPLHVRTAYAQAESPQNQTDSLTMDTRSVADSLIESARSHLGTRYRLGATGPGRFDCSGFTSYVYRQFGYSLPRTSSEQAIFGRELEGSLSNLQKGDIIIFGSRRNPKRVGHVGIFIGPDESGETFSFIHASSKEGIKISSSKEKYYSTRFLGARRVLPDFLEGEASGNALIPVDTDSSEYGKHLLQIPSGDSCAVVILLKDGSWAYLKDDGSRANPDSSEAFVLHQGGRWNAVRVSSLTIPTSALNKTGKAESPQDSTKPAPAAESGHIYHKIKSGDSLSKIAKRYHTTTGALCRLNGITPKTILKIGRKLRVK